MATHQKFSIYRFDPERDVKPYMQTFELDLSLCKGVMLLDALNAIKGNLDESLAYRRSCSEGVCGSDGMNINGKNGLACITPLNKLAGDKAIIVRPLTGMAVKRDLVVDLTNFFQQYEQIQPFLQASANPPSREYLQSPAQRAKLDGLYECILCACCSSACPSYWWNQEKFVGPAAALQAARFINDNRDIAKADRLKKLDDFYSIHRCRSIYNCADVCPKGLSPAEAIADIRKQMLRESL